MFALYPPPVAVLWQFVTPGRFVLSAVVGVMVVGQTWLMVHMYTGKARDQKLLDGEVMHEYNAKFVNVSAYLNN